MPKRHRVLMMERGEDMAIEQLEALKQELKTLEEKLAQLRDYL